MLDVREELLEGTTRKHGFISSVSKHPSQESQMSAVAVSDSKQGHPESASRKSVFFFGGGRVWAKDQKNGNVTLRNFLGLFNSF